jgi:ATP-dependent RNA helicase DDX47/RRP3
MHTVLSTSIRLECGILFIRLARPVNTSDFASFNITWSHLFSRDDFFTMTPDKKLKLKKESKKVKPTEGEEASSVKKLQETESTTKKEDTTEVKGEEDQQTKDEAVEEEEEGIMTESTFESLGVVEPLYLAAEKLGWKVASRIQAGVLPHAFEGKDIVGLAETGSGKTGAFCIPILQELLANPVRGAVYAVILAPTRELAFQIHEVVEGLGIAMGVNSVCIVGGVDIATQSIALARNPHVVVATPGRLVDHLTHTKGFNLRKVRYLIMDEADRMLSLDFEQELNQILDVMPDSTSGRRTMLFSATMTSKVEKLQRASLHNPVRIEVSTKFQTPKKLLQSYIFIPAKYKDCYLTYLVNEHAGQSMLVFGATCNNVQRLALMLRNLGFPAVCLHGQMSQPKRLGALNKFKSGDREILICTDVAARGLDIPSVDVVINFDLPGHGKDYIHRVGRTARAGRSGKAIAMVTQYDVEVYQRLEGLLGKKLPELKLEEETVLVLLERVNEAQRLATRELKEQLAAMGNQGGRRKRVSGDDGDGDDMEKLVERELKKGYFAGGSGGRGGALPNQRGYSGKPKPKSKKQRR